MRLNENYTLKMVCYVNDKETGTIKQIFEEFTMANDYVEKKKRPVSDIHFGYVVVDNLGETPEECEPLYLTPEEAALSVVM